MHYSLARFERSEVAKQRLRIIEFYKRYGERATKEAFGVDRRLVSRWRRRLADAGGDLSALVPLSTRPHRVRRSDVAQQIIDFIRSLREEHPRLGKEKIKPLLDEYCARAGLKTVSESTIGNIIKRHNLFYQKSGRAYHDPRRAQRSRGKRLRVKRSPRPKEFGYIISDTVELVMDGIKRYFISAIDIKSRFALTLPYERLSSRNMRDFYERFRELYPLTIKCWQSDNGSENLGEFDKALEDDGVSHLFSYPRCPKINAYIERYNILYNTTRPHKSLGLKNPVNYMIENNQMSQKYLTYTLCG